MNIDLLYRDGRQCKLCDRSETHAVDCPGEILERLTYEVTYGGPNCNRSCCGYTDGASSGATLEEAVRRAAGALSETVSHSCEVRLVAEIDADINNVVREERDRQVAVLKAKEATESAERAARRKAETIAHSLTSLEMERPDLVPEAYERRKAEILAA